jgi:hypothetical protein
MKHLLLPLAAGLLYLALTNPESENQGALWAVTVAVTILYVTLLGGDTRPVEKFNDDEEDSDVASHK